MADRDPTISSGDQLKNVEVCLAWAQNILEAASEGDALILFEARINEMKRENHHDLAEALSEIIESTPHVSVRSRAMEALDSLALPEEDIAIYRRSVEAVMETKEGHEADIEAALVFLSILNCRDEEKAFDILKRNLKHGPLEDRSLEHVANVLIQLMKTSRYFSVQMLARTSLHSMQLKKDKIDQLILNHEMREAKDDENALKRIIEEDMKSGYLSRNTPDVRAYLLEIAKGCPHHKVVRLVLFRLADLLSGEMIGSEPWGRHEDAESEESPKNGGGKDMVREVKPWHLEVIKRSN